MGYLLLFLLIIELITFYYFNGKNVVSPSFLGCALFLLSTVMYLSAGEYYQYELHIETVLVIVFLLCCIFLGEVFANRIQIRRKNSIQVAQVALTTRVVCVLLAIFVFLVSILYFYEVYLFSLSVGNTAGQFFTMTKYVREARLNGIASFDAGIISNQGGVVSLCILYMCVYAICAHKNRTGKIYWRYFLPIIAYFPHVIATDNRTDLLRTVAICTIIVFVFIKQKQGWKKQGNAKIIFIGMGAVCAFLVAFRWLGYRTEASLRSEVWNNITAYTSSSLVGLDIYLQNGEAPNVLFGERTLSGIYNILRQWGFPIPVVPAFEEFYTYAHGVSNAYTTFKAYIKDYTMVGAAVAMFLWGAVIRSAIRRIKETGVSFVRVSVLGMMLYPVCMLSIADTTSAFLSIATVYTLVYLFLLDNFVIRRRTRIRIQ